MTAANPINPPLERAKPCIRCGYDLRGHDDEKARCPECGYPVFWSLRAPEKLSEFPAGWVSSMAWGVRLLALAYGSVFAILVIGALQWLPQRAEEEVVLAVLVPATFAQAAGMWLLARHSGHAHERKRSLNRWTLRLGSIAGIIVGLGAVAVEQDLLRGLATLILFPAAVAAVFAPPAAFLRLRHVARLISNTALAEHSAIVAAGFLLTPAMIGIVALLGMSNIRPPDIAMFLTMATICVMVLLFLLWGAFIMLCCVIDFARAAKVARAEWRTRGEGAQ